MNRTCAGKCILKTYYGFVPAWYSEIGFTEPNCVQRIVSIILGWAMAQAISCQPFTVKAQV